MKHQVTVSTDRPLVASAEFRIGVRSVPYLADHGFHDMVVLPGSVYVDLALRLARELSPGVAGRVRNVTFHNPIILSTDDTIVQVDVREHGDGLSYPLDRFDVSLAPGEPARILRVDRTPGDRCGWTLHSFVPGPGLIGAVVVEQAA